MESTAPSTMDNGFDILVVSAPFRRLTKMQKVWVLEYLSNGQDAIAAARVAHPDANPKSQVVMSYQITQSPAVQDVLDFHRWRDARTALIAIAKQNLKAAEPGGTAAGKFAVQLERLLLHVPGSNGAHFEDPDEDPDEPDPTIKNDTPVKTFTVGMRVTERDPADGILHVGEVTAVAADGTPTFKEIL